MTRPAYLRRRMFRRNAIEWTIALGFAAAVSLAVAWVSGIVE